MDKGAKGSSLETAQKQQESEQANSKLGSQTVNQKMKNMKGKEKKNEVTEPGNDMDEFCSPEDLLAGDLMEQEKPNKKQRRVKEAPSKESDQADGKPQDTASRETIKEKPTLKMEKKAQKSNDMKRSKSLKVGNENAKTNKSLKLARKVKRRSGTVKEQSSEEHADAEDLGLFSGNLLIKISCCVLTSKLSASYYQKVHVNVSKCIRCSYSPHMLMGNINICEKNNSF